MEFRDYYQTLGVAREASQDEIRKAFRKLARQYHPDVAKDKKHAEERFKEINEAYEVLGDAEKRRKYDQLGSRWQAGEDFRPPPDWESVRGGRGGGFEFGGTGFSDFFEAFFGGRGADIFESFEGGGAHGPRAGRGGRAAGRRGADVEGEIMVTLEEALRGSTRAITVRRDRGRQPETYQVRIPVGVREGQLIRLAGQGEAGVGAGSAGDLFLRVRFERHPDFDVQESDLIYELPLAPWEAVLGCTASVPTLSGPANLKIPPGTQNGSRLRLRGQGLPRRGEGRGDLLVRVEIEVPARPDEAEKEAWRELSRRSRFRAR